MNDIETRADLDLMLRRFYEKLLADERIAYIFTDVAKIDLETHLPKIGNFWEMSLLGTGSYSTNVMRVHMDLHEQTSLKPEHFNIWLDHFYSVTDSLFAGPVAEMAKTRALSIATVMQIKMS